MAIPPANSKENTMLTRHTLLRSALVVTLTLAGCGSMRPSQKNDFYQAAMSGAQEVPAASTPARGTAEVELNRATLELSWKVTYQGLTGPASAAHIHGPAAAGSNAGVVVPFTNVTAQPIQGKTTITPAQAADLAAGRWYVNVHTAQYPGGEIRGQLQMRQ
jgi:hypothetical protein